MKKHVHTVPVKVDIAWHQAVNAVCNIVENAEHAKHFGETFSEIDCNRLEHAADILRKHFKNKEDQTLC